MRYQDAHTRQHEHTHETTAAQTPEVEFSFTRLVGLALVLAFSILIAACGPDNSSSSTPAAAASVTIVSLDQGWSAQTSEQFHFTSQGSEMLRYDYFLALEQATNTMPFASNENLVSFRYLPSAQSALNPDGLPIGFAKNIDPNSGIAYFGPTCAFCHVSQINYKNTGMLIEGAGTLADFSSFFNAMLDSLQATIDDSAKFNRFAESILGPNYTQTQADALYADLVNTTAALVRRNLQNTPKIAPGFGRLDAFGNIFNLLMGDEVGEPSNIQQPADPVSVPFLWTTAQCDLVQWNGSASNAGPLGPLLRNIGEVIGVFGNLQTEPGSLSGYPSTIDLTALGNLEVSVQNLLSPQWPDQYLPPIDTAKAAQGQVLYNQYCANCHQLIDRTQTDLDIAVNMVPVDEIGTDPSMAVNAATRSGLTGTLEGTPQYIIGGPIFGPTAAGTAFLDNAVIGVLLSKPFQGIDAAINEYEAIAQAMSFNPESYKGRPLNGIWATAPYLHNGSVPSLAQLLLPPSQRITKFYLGSREFDPVNVGFITSKTPGAFLYDTTLPGNSNEGHIGGATLNEQQRKELLEFLKTL
jgi:hypothetical protein